MIKIKQKKLNEHLKKQIYAGFSRHAIAATGHDGKFDPVVFVATEGSNFAGTIVGELFWGTLHIKYLYVEENYRNQGLGTKLMNHVSDYAVKNKCPFIFVETMSFQALPFYEKCGFILEYTRSGYSHNTSFHYLRKDL